MALATEQTIEPRLDLFAEIARLKGELFAYHRDPTSSNQATASTTLNNLSQSRQFELKRQLGGESAGKKSPDIVDNS